MLCKSEIISKLQGALLGKDAHQLMAPVGRQVHFGKQTMEHAKQSSVLIILDIKDDVLSCILTKRTEKLHTHPGQISFPGGAAESGETPYQTALRECKEELGIEEEQISYVSQLSPLYIPVSNYIIHPFVAWNKAASPSINSVDEVAEIIHFPISSYLDKSRWNKASVHINSQNISVPAFVHNEHIVWGATAMILAELIVLLNAH